MLGELFDGAAKLFVGLILLGFGLLVLIGGNVGILRCDEIVRLVGHQNIGSNRDVLNRFAARSVVLGNRENQRASVLKIDRLLDRAGAECLIAKNVAAGVIQNRTGDDFSGSGGGFVDDYDQGQAGNRLRGIGGKVLARILLPFQIGDLPVIQEQVCGRDALGDLAIAGVAKIEDQLFRAALLQITDTLRRSPACGPWGSPRCECIQSRYPAFWRRRTGISPLRG